MITWGEIRVGYYVALLVLAWVFHGSPSAIFLAILIGLFCERDFKRWVFSRFDVVGDDGAMMKALSAAKATAKERGKANGDADTKAKPKASKPRSTAAKKPKPATVDD